MFYFAAIFKIIFLSLFPSMNVILDFINNRQLAELLRRWTCKPVSLPCEGSNPTMNTIFCNVHLFRVPRSCTGTVQMKSRARQSSGVIGAYRERKIIEKMAALIYPLRNALCGNNKLWTSKSMFTGTKEITKRANGMKFSCNYIPRERKSV